MKARKNNTTGIQLELFSEYDYRSMTDRQLIGTLTKHVDEVADVWEHSYRMELLYNSLTPHVRRVAMAAIELYKRKDLTKRNRQKISSSTDIYNYMAPVVGDLNNEELWCMGINNFGRLIGRQRISLGGIDHTCADVRVIIGKAIEMQATQIAVVHNHPSGNIRPSHDDDKITERIAGAAKLMGIRLLDHVIISAGAFYSYNDEGRL